jgi:general secretion pathway protein M
MQLMPNAERGRFLAIVLLAIALILGYLLGVHWWFTARHVEIAAEVQDLRDRELGFRRTASQRAAIEKRLAEVRAFEAGNPAFLSEGDFDSAAAGLSQRLKQVITAHAKDAQSCQIIMNQYSRPTDKELFERASIRVRLRCSLEEFSPILHELESTSPVLFIDDVQVWKQTGYRQPGSNQVSSYLDIQFTLSGYLRRGQRAEPGTPAASGGKA